MPLDVGVGLERQLVLAGRQFDDRKLRPVPDIVDAPEPVIAIFLIARRADDVAVVESPVKRVVPVVRRHLIHPDASDRLLAHCETALDALEWLVEMVAAPTLDHPRPTVRQHIGAAGELEQNCLGWISTRRHADTARCRQCIFRLSLRRFGCTRRRHQDQHQRSAS